MSFLRGYARKRVSFECEGPSRVVESEAYKTDINYIVAQYVKTGDASKFSERLGSFGDVSEVKDLISCQNVLRDAAEAFATLPAKIRDAFGNDPTVLASALSDPAQRDRLVELGIFEASGTSVPGASTPGASAAGSSNSASS